MKKLQHKVGSAWRDLGARPPSKSITTLKRHAARHAKNTQQYIGHNYRIVTGRNDRVLVEGGWNGERIEWQ